MELVNKKNNMGIKEKGISFLLVWIMIFAFIVIIIPIETPTVKGQVTHLWSASEEDNFGFPYDIGPVGDGEVIWDPDEDHILNFNYMIEPDMTLNIPALNYSFGDPGEHEISFTDHYRIDVYGKLITNDDGNWLTKTAFMASGIYPGEGIYFHPGSEGKIVDCRFEKIQWGVKFEPGSRLLSPGIRNCAFVDNTQYGLQLLSTEGSTNIEGSYFDDRASPQSSILVQVVDTQLNITDTNFLSHHKNDPALYISDSIVNINEATFYNDDKEGNSIYIKGDSSGSVLRNVYFQDGYPGDHYIRSEGVSFFLDNCSFKTSNGARSILAADNDTTSIPSHITLRNPTADGWPGFWDDTFDNSSMNVTGASSITLQWYQNVLVEDPDGNPIDNAPVWVVNRNDDPADPATALTGLSGWAEWVTCTELIIYESSVTNFNPFNASALNNTMTGYLIPEIDMTMSKESVIVVPFSPVPNNPPWISYIQTPSGIQSGPVSIQFTLQDTNPGDDGNLSIMVEYYHPGDGTWKIATAHPTSDPTTNLNSNVMYTFVWDSNAAKNLPGLYFTDVKIRITPSDRAGSGTSDETGPFIVDNVPPDLISGPTANPTDTTATITWTMSKVCMAYVRYGLDGSLVWETPGSSGSTLQEVTLTGLSPGRNYTYVITSITEHEIEYTSFPTTFTFETEIHMQLYEGWNLISFAPYIVDQDIDAVLSSIAGQYNSVQWFDASDPADPWKHYVPGKPFGNDLLTITNQMGLWIHMKNDAILEHDNQVVNPADPPLPVILLEGWNMIGYPSVTTRAVDDALDSINYDMIKTYDAETGEWLSWDGSSGDLATMELGRGYWIHVPEMQLLQLSYV
jgi:hypothetical protein